MARTRGNGPVDLSSYPVASVGTARPPRKSRARQIVLWVLLSIAGVLLLIFGVIFLFVQRTLPTTSGEITLDGLSEPVTVARDSNGIPHITASNIHDVFKAEGYVHAQDRLFQMDFYRRVGGGRLSEVLGATTLDTDKFLRTIGFRRAAVKDYDGLSAEYRVLLQDYADGVNAFIDTHGDSLPLEFTILGYRPEAWTGLDTIAFGKVMAWNLSENMDIELTMADLQAKLGPERAAQLFPAYPDDKPTIVRDSALPGSPTGHNWSDPVRALLGDPPVGQIGSNNWVVGGARSVSGTPLLANDPHLAVSNPSIWYAIGMRATDGSFDATGMSFAGAPGIVIGHNRDIAWGVTNLGPDTQDLYVETLDPAGHPNQYYYDGAWTPMEVLNESIRVKGAEDVSFDIHQTRHGPLMNSVMPNLTKPTSLRWAGALTGGLLKAIIRLDDATNWYEFRQALEDWDVAGQNFVYADMEGNIGYQSTGRWPLRQSGDGLTPVDGSVANYEWTGFVPYSEMPTMFNPPEGYIVTANNRVVSPSYPHQATAWWFPWFRAERITQMIKAKDKLTLDDFKAIQLDTHNIIAQKLAVVAVNLQSNDTRVQSAINLLKGWDGNISATGAAPVLFEIAYQKVATNTLSDELGDALATEYRDKVPRAQDQLLYGLLDQPDSIWWDNIATTTTENRDSILLKSITEAVAELTTTQGADMNTWSWGKIHTVSFEHPLGSVQPLDKILNIGPFPNGGDGQTVAAAAFKPAVSYEQTLHPSMRLLFDSGDWSRTQMILTPGNSGQPFSKHWGDMVQDWLKGGYRPMLWTEEEVVAAAQDTLTLKPYVAPTPTPEGTPEE